MLSDWSKKKALANSFESQYGNGLDLEPRSHSFRNEEEGHRAGHIWCAFADFVIWVFLFFFMTLL